MTVRKQTDLRAIERYEISIALDLALKEANDYAKAAADRGATHMQEYWGNCAHRIIETKAKFDAAYQITLVTNVPEGANDNDD